MKYKQWQLASPRPQAQRALEEAGIPTLLAGLLTARCKSKWLAPLPPVLCNGLIVGAMIAFQETGLSGAFPAAFAFNAVTVAAGEALACYVLGMLLLEVLTRSRILPKRAWEQA